MTRPPNIGPKGPQRNKINPPKKPETQVEMEKIDPQELLEAAIHQDKGPVERTTEDHLTPMNRYAPLPAKAQEEAAKALETPEVKLPPPKEADDPLERGLSGGLIERLSARFKLVPEHTEEGVLECGSEKIKVTIRKPTYDDYLWTLGALEQKLESNIDGAMVQGTAQRSKFLQHMTACRSVVKIEDEWVWDVFQYREVIEEAVPGWSGESFSAVPDGILSSLTHSVHVLFRQLHPDMLFQLEQVVDEQFPGVIKEDDDDDDTDDENPAEAA